MPTTTTPNPYEMTGREMIEATDSYRRQARDGKMTDDEATAAIQATLYRFRHGHVAPTEGDAVETRVPTGYVCTVFRSGAWEVSFSADSDATREAEYDLTVRRFDWKTEADAYHAGLVRQFVEAVKDAADARRRWPRLYAAMGGKIQESGARSAVSDRSPTGPAPARTGQTAEAGEPSDRPPVGSAAGFGPAADDALGLHRESQVSAAGPVVPLAFAAAFALLAAGQVAAHVQAEDAARKARHAFHIESAIHDAEQGYEGRVTEPAGVPRAARPFRGEVA